MFYAQRSLERYNSDCRIRLVLEEGGTREVRQAVSRLCAEICNVIVLLQPWFVWLGGHHELAVWMELHQSATFDTGQQHPKRGKQQFLRPAEMTIDPSNDPTEGAAPNGPYSMGKETLKLVAPVTISKAMASNVLPLQDGVTTSCRPTRVLYAMAPGHEHPSL
jgi:hypothetical protein